MLNQFVTKIVTSTKIALNPMELQTKIQIPPLEKKLSLFLMCWERPFSSGYQEVKPEKVCGDKSGDGNQRRDCGGSIKTP
jgi:hypothetical protein